MANYVVKKELIDILVTALVRDAARIPKRGQTAVLGGLNPFVEADVRKQCNEAGARLWGINVENVNRRYDEENEVPAYEFEQENRDPATVLAAVDVYEGESLGWLPDPGIIPECDTIRRQWTHRLPAVAAATSGMLHLR